MTAPNDWQIKKCLWLSLAILLAMLGLFGLGSLGFDIPILRQIVGFIFLTFVPGVLILRILRVHNVGIIESLLYSVGLSVTFVMFCGMAVNFLLPLLGISQPISAVPLIVTFSIFMLILMLAAYIRDRNFQAPTPINMGKLFSPAFLLLILLPILAALGGYLVNYYQNNILLLVLILAIAAIVGLAAFGKFISEKIYPFAIIMIAIALLWHITLSSSWLSGGDIHVEYYFQNLVLQSGWWNATIPNNVNGTLSIVMLMPIYSLLLNIDPVWVFNLIHPLVFALVPLALFYIYREQIGDKRAFLSAFFFMSVFTFFAILTQAARQEIAELFFVLLILLLIDRKLAHQPKTTLAIVFSLSLVVSHYAVGYIALTSLIGAWVLLLLMKSKARMLWQWLTNRFGGLPQDIISDRALPTKNLALIIGIFLAFALLWYGGIAGGSALKTIIGIGQQQAAPGAVPALRESLIYTALGLDFMSASALGKAWRIFQYITELFLIIGFIRLLLKPKGFRAEYIALSMMFALVLFLCIVLPRFSYYWDVTRFYHVALFFLSPLFILGGETTCEGISRLFRRPSLRGSLQHNSAYLSLITIAIIIPSFLFHTGFIFEVSGSNLGTSANIYDQPWTRALSGYRIDTAVFNLGEAAAVRYLSKIVDDKTPIYADEYGYILLCEQFPWGQACPIRDPSGAVPDDAYIFLRTWNIRNNEIAIAEVQGGQREVIHLSIDTLPALSQRLENSPLIYNNGAAQIIAPR
jgi:uncharacterized membrane protein